MAVIGYTADNTVAGVRVITWASMAVSDTGTPFICAMYADRTVQVHGNFSVGGNVIMEGTNQPTGPSIYATLNDPLGNTVSISTAKVQQILENTFYIRPRISAGDASTSLTVRLLVSTPTGDSIFVADTV